MVVRFANGGTSATLEGAVVRGERDVYRVGAAEGQTLHLVVGSVEDNAVFDVVASDGAILANEETITELVLPRGGNYLVIVGGTRGNAEYVLTVRVLATPIEPADLGHGEE